MWVVIAAINSTKIGQLILSKIIRIVATRYQILRLKCTIFDFGWVSAPDPAGEAYSASPDPPVGFNGPTRNGMAPDYIQDLCVPVSTVSTRSALRSTARGDLVIPYTRRRLGNRAFSVAGTAASNNLPPDIRIASTLCSFKNLLKTH